MDNPAHNLIVLKQICKELQKELAYSMPDVEAIKRLSEDVVHLGAKLADWARAQ